MKINYFKTLIFLIAGIAIFSSCKDDPTCFDGEQNQGELGIDCCGPCDSACVNIPNCVEVTNTPTCSDGIQNGDETGIDCGGSCADCVTDTCNNNVQDGDETGVDCGGSCPACPGTDPLVTLKFNGVNKTFNEGDITVSFAEGAGLNISGSKLTINGIEGVTLFIPEANMAFGSYVIGGVGNPTASFTQNLDFCSGTSGSFIVGQIDVAGQTVSGTFNFDCNFEGTGSSGEAIEGVFSNISW